MTRIDDLPSLSARIRSCPVAVDAERARDLRARLPDLSGPLAGLVAASGACSPFLHALAGIEAEWLPALDCAAPEALLAGLVEPLDPEAPPDAVLRRRKRRLALLVALADLGGVWSLEEVTGALTRFADFAVASALTHHLGVEQRRGRLPPGDVGVFVLAMGKMGAEELNYSSDIDLICLFDETRHPPGDYAEIRAALVRVVQRMVRSLSATTAEGYVFRTDLRLRPDPSVTPVCIGAGVAEAYYESVGRTWERAAMIKARPCAGDLAAGEAFLVAIAPFVWRRHLDFAAIEEAHDMQRRIRDHKGLHGPLQVPGHDVKLGRGGIRAIEFFVQTRQLISGGRDPRLRLRATIPTLHRLAEAGWIAPEIAEALEADYRAHRALEHRIQMLEDAQTHLIPKAEPARRRLAGLHGAADLARFEAALGTRFERVDRLTEAFFAPHQPGQAVTPERLAELGYARPDQAMALIERWMAGRIAATRSARARGILKRILGEIVQRLAGAASPDEAMVRFDAFLSGLPAGVQILSLFEANPQLLDLLAEIFAASPRLAEEMARHPGVLDALLDRDFFAPMPGMAAQLAALRTLLEGESDYERVLDAARRWAHEQQFRAGVQLLRGIAGAEETGVALSAIAEATLRALAPHVTAHMARRHGPPPGRGAAILGMGKLGSREMTISSDLDLIVVYDAAGQTQSDGPRPLSASAWYARFTQALIAALTAPTAEGVLYAVDMRLRPSGRKGPVAVPLSGFARYQREEAWTWEHMALTRARVVGGPEDLGEEVAGIIRDVLTAPRPRPQVIADAAAMRARLAEAHAATADDLWEVKHRPGGMMDIELLVQAGILVCGLAGLRAPLRALPKLAEHGFLTAEEAGALAAALELQTVVQHYARLAVAGRFSPEAAGKGLVQALTRACGARDLPALAERLAAVTDRARAIVDARLGAP
ncbi:MAG: glutamate-ammonia-ligase adenylyltransferase [Paracoccaceae bacterium]|nr:MAG: glutamate-ammonia-ligase adenylyltransferase [Paracoccaceae bacterium]